jgi:hypothetical protein
MNLKTRFKTGFEAKNQKFFGSVEKSAFYTLIK